MNILNPALTARGILFLLTRKEISGDIVWIADKADAYSGATPLGHALVGEVDKIPSVADMFWGFIPDPLEKPLFLPYLLVPILIITGVGSWRIMLSMVCQGPFYGIYF